MDPLDLKKRRGIEEEDEVNSSSFCGDCLSIDSIMQGEEDWRRTDLARSLPILHPSRSIPLDLDSYDCVLPSTVEDCALFRNYTSMSLCESASDSLSPMYPTYYTCPYVLEQDEEDSDLKNTCAESCDSGPVSLDCERDEGHSLDGKKDEDRTGIPHQKYRYPCRDYEVGICSRGDRCKFYHDPNKRLPENVCFIFFFDV